MATSINRRKWAALLVSVKVFPFVAPLTITVVYGIFLALGEVGPGDNIGLVASKTSASAIRGQYYGIAAAIGKIGAFVGNYIFPYIIAAAGDDPIKQGQYPFFVSSAFCIFTAFLAIFFLPHIGQDTIEEEDVRFKTYLVKHGYDVSTMGTKDNRETMSTVSEV
jgi:nitrate/nitrite transporter NarK